jgi:nitrogen fixation/metabolism regulation signal transduction histidine kinase
MVAMESRLLTRHFTGVLPLAVLSLLLLAAMFMMSAAAQNSAIFGRLYSLLLLVNILGIVLLLAVILFNFYQLLEQYRARTLGSRLTLRLLAMFVVLAVLPVTTVFVFSLQILNRGIDNWFDVKVEQALDDALLLGRTALDAIKHETLKNAHEMATELEGVSDPMAVQTLNYLREQNSVTELTLFTQDGKIIASSSEIGPESGTLVPDQPRENEFSQIRQGKSYANLDTVGTDELRLRIIVPVYARDMAAPMRILQVLKNLPSRYTKLGESVQSAYAEYEKLLYLRGPLKFGFTLTLSLVALLAMLIAVWAAIFSARRVVAPIRDLAEGTRAVALGDYRKQIPVQSLDEIGVLVESFNDMTRRIHRAQTQIKRSQRESEIQRTYLETVLTHMSSGVLSFDQQGILRTHNTAASGILRVNLAPGIEKPLAWISKAHPHLATFVDLVTRAVDAGKTEWRFEIALNLDQGGPRTVLLRGTSLPGLGGRHGGFVVVFDDVTALIEAQRSAAWADVARRMAHEIKNPLTPIQLSAERIRHKFLSVLGESDRLTLDRATRIIVEQVEALKLLVNAFSDYARPASIDSRPTQVNDLVRDVVELYKDDQRSARIKRILSSTDTSEIIFVRVSDTSTKEKKKPHAILPLTLDLEPELPLIKADPGRIRQVLHNLLLNSHDAMTTVRKPAITIRTRAVMEAGRPCVKLEISDTGPGFPVALIERLFEPYVTNKERGTGLGLAIVKHIVEEHGGTIHAENSAQGGAVVRIWIPALDVDAPALTPRELDAIAGPRAERAE